MWSQPLWANPILFQACWKLAAPLLVWVATTVAEITRGNALRGSDVEENRWHRTCRLWRGRMLRCVISIAVLLGVTGCSDIVLQHPMDSTRAPLGKSDTVGSCGDADSCGGKSDGNCWCDEECFAIGDCCEDVETICFPDEEEEPRSESREYCADGTVVMETTYLAATEELECASSKTHCVTHDPLACPKVPPLPPDYCEDGVIVPAPPTYILSADGMECERPSFQCLTKDLLACPQQVSPAPDFCPSGTVVPGADAFMPSTDGLMCRVPTFHCVTADPAVCEPMVDSCSGGELAFETRYRTLDDGLQCRMLVPHCVASEADACPPPSPMPPSFCPNGRIVSGTPSYAESFDGTECVSPTLHCVTLDESACPRMTPPPTCTNGHLVEEVPTFIESTDGMECEVPRLHCLSVEPGACVVDA